MARHGTQGGSGFDPGGPPPPRDLQAVKQKRPGPRMARHDRVTRRRPFMRNTLSGMGFILETSAKTNKVTTTGWPAKGARLSDPAPSATAPGPESPVGREPMAPRWATIRGLTPGQPAIPETPQGFAGHAHCFRARPTVGRLPDPSNSSHHQAPVKLAFAQLKGSIRRATARACDALWRGAGHGCDACTEGEC